MALQNTSRLFGAFLATAVITTELPAADPPRTTSAPAVSDSTRLTSEEPEILTDAEFNWVVTLQVTNGLESGLYLDSLFCDIEDLDPGETRADRRTRLDLRSLSQLSPAIPALSSNVIQHSGPALAERARLTYSLHCHRSTGSPFTITTVIEAKPGGSSAYPSTLLDVGGRKVELVLVPAQRDTGRGPGVFVIHGHGSHARHSIRSARHLSVRGYSVAIVSMPGYGQSAGPSDFMGPATSAAAAAALEHFRQSGKVDPQRIVVWGQSRGATVAAGLAARDARLRGVILQSGIYDLWATYRGTGLPGFQEAIVAEAGKDSAAWRDRSPILIADQVKVPVLILHGERDGQVPIEQAHAMAARIQEAGGRVETQYAPLGGHAYPPNLGFRAGLAFIEKHLTP
jgi:pimeloyl-ACP methyl ester carboxylesterase